MIDLRSQLGQKLLSDAPRRERVEAAQMLCAVKPMTLEVAGYLLAALDDRDPEVRDWAMAGLRRTPKRLRRKATPRLWEIFGDRRRRATTRAYAIEALDHLGECPGPEQLADIARERGGLPNDPTLRGSFRAFGRHAPPEEGALRALLRATTELPPHRFTDGNWTVVDAALFSLARDCIRQRNLDDAEAAKILPKRITDKLERQGALKGSDLNQTVLFALPDPVLPERVPGHAQQDHSDDAERAATETLSGQRRETRLLIARDGKIARQAKAATNNRCEICGCQAQPGGGGARVEAHHVHELGDGGADAPENLIVVCSGCHHRIHDGAIEVENQHVRGQRALKVRVPSSELEVDLGAHRQPPTEENAYPVLVLAVKAALAGVSPELRIRVLEDVLAETGWE